MSIVPSTGSGTQICKEEYSSTETSESETRKDRGNMKVLEKKSSFQNEEGSRSVEQSANTMTISDSASVEQKISKSCVMQSSMSSKTVSQVVQKSASQFSETQVEEYEYED